MKEEEILIKYQEEIGNCPILDQKEENKLIKRAQNGDTNAKEKLIKANSGTIIGIALECARDYHKLHLLDLIQEGNIALLGAIKKFRSEFNCKLYIYASWWIRQAILDAIYTHGDNISIPYRAATLINKFLKTGGKLFDKLGYQPSLKQIAREMGVPLEKVKQVFQYSKIKSTLSLDDFMGDGKKDTPKERYSDQVTESKELNPEKLTQIKELKEKIRKKLSFYSPREEKVLRMRFGIGEAEKTLEEAGREFRVTRETIRQIEARVLGKLRLDLIQKQNKKLSDYI